MKHRVFRFGVGVAIWIAVVGAFLIKATPHSQAAVKPSNSGVFAGRFIPAFIGAAYDPQTAYQELSGLPVYVFAFDFWGDPTKNTVDGSWIISNLAIRTQVRADGTFQVQGLPVASHYGVYFPFALSGNKVVRTDCPTRDEYVAVNDTGNNPCKGQKVWPFRMPRPEDRLLDVFSYAAHYLATEAGADAAPNYKILNNVDSQIPVGSGFEKVRIEHAFITNKNEVDVENNINTFPLVPNTTLRVSIDSAEGSGSEFEVQAVRISRTAVGGAGSTLSMLNFPAVVGRAIRVSENAAGGVGGFNEYVFQAFAPPGYYAVTVWRREIGSPSYREWDGSASLNSHRTGWALIDVEDLGAGSDWRRMIGITDPAYRIKTLANRIIVWGTVTNELGYPLSAAASLPDAKVNIRSAANRDYVGATVALNDIYMPSTGAMPVTARFGVYAFSTPLNLERVPQNDELSIYVENPSYSKGTVQTGMIHSLAGPRRFDINTTRSTGGNDGGYDTGAYVQANLSSGKPASGGKVTIGLLKPENSQIVVPAQAKTYYLNALGETHIPLGDLVIGSSNFSDYQFVARIALDNEIKYVTFTLDSNGYADLSGQTLASVGFAPSEKYNLAILNKISDLVNSNKAYAAATYQPVYVYLNVQQPVSGELNAVVYHADGPNAGNVCGDCGVWRNYANGTGTQLPDGNVNLDGLGSFVVTLPQPASLIAASSACAASLGNIPYCKSLSESTIATQSSVYELRVQGEVLGVTIEQTSNRMTVDSLGNTSPPVQLNIGQNCKVVGALATQSAKKEEAGTGFTWSKALLSAIVPAYGAYQAGSAVSSAVNSTIESITGYDISAAIMGSFVQLACSTGETFISNVPLMMGMIYKYGLQTRALTQDQPVLRLYDVVRNIVNVLFVLIIIGVGIMTILHYQPEQWHLRVLLPELIKALFFANFALIIVQGLLDLNNFASYTIFQFTEGIVNSLLTVSGSKANVGIAGVGGGAAVVGAVATAATSMAVGMTAFIASAVGTGGLSIIALIVFIMCVAAVIFVQIALLLLIFFARYLLIWMGTIAAPAVFALSVLPWFSSLRPRWWKVMTAVTSMQTIVAGVLSTGVLLLTIGSDENSLFNGFGTAIIGLITLYTAFKMPTKLLGSAGLSIGALGAASAAGLASSLGGKLKGLGKTRQLENAAWEAQYKMENPDTPITAATRLRRGVSTAFQAPFRSIQRNVLGGEAAAAIKLDDAEKAKVEAMAFRNMVANNSLGEKNADKGIINPIKPTMMKDLDKAYEEMPLDWKITDLRGQAVLKADGTQMTAADLMLDSSGAQVNKLQFMKNFAAVNPQVGQQLLREARSNFRAKQRVVANQAQQAADMIEDDADATEEANQTIQTAGNRARQRTDVQGGKLGGGNTGNATT